MLVCAVALSIVYLDWLEDIIYAHPVSNKSCLFFAPHFFSIVFNLVLLTYMSA